MFPPALPTPSSWFPGHMSAFMRNLPTLLTRTDIVLELRDSRLPLTSINPNFESYLRLWKGGSKDSIEGVSTLRERIIVFSKMDLVPTWGVTPFTSAMSKFDPSAHIHFMSSQEKQSVTQLLRKLTSLAEKKGAGTETNVLVVGMPNVGKSSILNVLRSFGIVGRTAKAMQTSAQPGKTRALSTRLKLSEEPRVYAYDSPGVMVPFLGKGEHGAESGTKLALIAGLKESMYDIEVLAHYLLYRLWKLDPLAPPYQGLLPTGTDPDLEIERFLDLVASRLGMLLPGGEYDRLRAAVWFVRWWREQGGKETARMKYPQTRRAAGWGFDFDWTETGGREATSASLSIEEKMRLRIDEYWTRLQAAKETGMLTSATQEKKKLKEELVARRRANSAKRVGQGV